MIKFRAAAATSSSSILLYVLIFEILSFTQVSADKLVGLNGDSQNSRYVEIRRSPGNRRPIDVPSIDSMPKAHGLSQYRSGDNGNNDNEQIRRSPTSAPQQQQQQSTNGNGFSSPFASMIPGMPSFGNNNNNMNNLFQFPMHHHPLFTQSNNNNNPMQHPSIPLPQHPLMHLSQLPSAPQQHSPAQSQTVNTATLSPVPLQTPIPTLSATLHPAFTLLPTLPTISFPTFPPFTMPPAFDQMASGYTKKKRRHKSRRKAPKKVYSTESNDDGTAEEQPHERTPIKKRPSKKTLEKVESRLPKYANDDLNNGGENVEKQEKWMVPYYGGSRKQKS